MPLPRRAFPATPVLAATPRPSRRRARQGPLGAPATRLSRPLGSDPVGAPSPPPRLRAYPGRHAGAPATPAMPRPARRRARQSPVGAPGHPRLLSLPGRLSSTRPPGLGRPTTPASHAPARAAVAVHPASAPLSAGPRRRGRPPPARIAHALHLVALREPPARHAHATGLGTATVPATPAPTNAPDIPSALSTPPRRRVRYARSPRSHTRRCRPGFPRGRAHHGRHRVLGEFA
ncbi:nascent polypeptide-associated complex subunit alpha, muscle-specific form-like [Panicum virgatum]|uniref:nascent polypeptide-associated complex subunit alpha, muscle-specific form-like n=1 Tax=Panicum virgatum TaxID=38727 RepID=UPI0019D56CE2|nr:nascent polypeptide-associated complex subunit alpha, muscle-specific form-like [Panicum virgatum]